MHEGRSSLLSPTGYLFFFWRMVLSCPQKRGAANATGHFWCVAVSLTCSWCAMRQFATVGSQVKEERKKALDQFFSPDKPRNCAAFRHRRCNSRHIHIENPLVFNGGRVPVQNFRVNRDAPYLTAFDLKTPKSLKCGRTSFATT